MNPLIVFIHGFCESSEIWDYVAGEIELSYEVRLLNLPGFGGTSLSADYSGLSHIAGWVKEQLPDDRMIFLVGHSLGGYVSMEFLRRFPKRTAGICLFHSTSLGDSEEKKTNREKTIRFIEKHGKEPFLKQFVPSLFFENNLAKQFGNHQKMERIAMQTPASVVIEYTKWMKDRPDYLGLFGKHNIPVLYISGQYDSFISPDITKMEVSKIPGAELEILENCGHLGMIETPQISAEKLINFINRVEF